MIVSPLTVKTPNLELKNKPEWVSESQPILAANENPIVNQDISSPKEIEKAYNDSKNL